MVDDTGDTTILADTVSFHAGKEWPSEANYQSRSLSLSFGL